MRKHAQTLMLFTLCDAVFDSMVAIVNPNIPDMAIGRIDNFQSVR